MVHRYKFLPTITERGDCSNKHIFFNITSLKDATWSCFLITEHRCGFSPKHSILLRCEIHFLMFFPGLGLLPTVSQWKSFKSSLTIFTDHIIIKILVFICTWCKQSGHPLIKTAQLLDKTWKWHNWVVPFFFFFFCINVTKKQLQIIQYYLHCSHIILKSDVFNQCDDSQVWVYLSYCNLTTVWIWPCGQASCQEQRISLRNSGRGWLMLTRLERVTKSSLKSLDSTIPQSDRLCTNGGDSRPRLPSPGVVDPQRSPKSKVCSSHDHRGSQGDGAFTLAKFSWDCYENTTQQGCAWQGEEQMVASWCGPSLLQLGQDESPSQREQWLLSYSSKFWRKTRTSVCTVNL